MVWGSGSLVKNLNNVLLRRLVDVMRDEKEGGSLTAPLRGYISASLSDITAFIDALVDELKIEALLKSFCLLDFPKTNELRREVSRAVHSAEYKSLFQNFPNSAYALLKLCYLPHPLYDKPVVLKPQIARRVAAGDGVEATRLAVQRLRSDGFTPAIDSVSVTAKQSQRIAAALMFPIGRRNAEYLANVVLRPAQAMNEAGRMSLQVVRRK